MPLRGLKMRNTQVYSDFYKYIPNTEFLLMANVSLLLLIVITAMCSCTEAMIVSSHVSHILTLNVIQLSTSIFKINQEQLLNDNGDPLPSGIAQ